MTISYSDQGDSQDNLKGNKWGISALKCGHLNLQLCLLYGNGKATGSPSDTMLSKWMSICPGLVTLSVFSGTAKQWHGVAGPPSWHYSVEGVAELGCSLTEVQFTHFQLPVCLLGHNPIWNPCHSTKYWKHFTNFQLCIMLKIKWEHQRRGKNMGPGTGMANCVSLRPVTQAEDAVLPSQQLMKTNLQSLIHFT